MRIKVLYNNTKSWTSKLVSELEKFLIKNSFTIVKKGADITICVGGDGTIYHNYYKKTLEGAILGLGSKTSFICRLKKEDWKKHILKVLKKPKYEKRITLQVLVGKKKFNSMNDVVVHTADYRVIGINVKISNNNKFFDGDGLIIATPTGSSGYAYSAGGTVIDEDANAIEIIPICPYRRKFSPLVIHEDVVVECYSDRSSDLIIDGIFIKKLQPKKKVKVKKGKYVNFVV